MYRRLALATAVAQLSKNMMQISRHACTIQRVLFEVRSARGSSSSASKAIAHTKLPSSGVLLEVCRRVHENRLLMRLRMRFCLWVLLQICRRVHKVRLRVWLCMRLCLRVLLQVRRRVHKHRFFVRRRVRGRMRRHAGLRMRCRMGLRLRRRRRRLRLRRWRRRLWHWSRDVHAVRRRWRVDGQSFDHRCTRHRAAGQNRLATPIRHSCSHAAACRTRAV